MAETVRFELTCDFPQTDFEQKAVSAAPSLSVPESYNMSIHSARFCKTHEFLREICEIDARNQLKTFVCSRAKKTQGELK